MYIYIGSHMLRVRNYSNQIHQNNIYINKKNQLLTTFMELPIHTKLTSLNRNKAQNKSLKEIKSSDVSKMGKKSMECKKGKKSAPLGENRPKEATFESNRSLSSGVLRWNALSQPTRVVLQNTTNRFSNEVESQNKNQNEKGTRNSIPVESQKENSASIKPISILKQYVKSIRQSEEVEEKSNHTLQLSKISKPKKQKSTVSPSNHIPQEIAVTSSVPKQILFQKYQSQKLKASFLQQQIQKLKDKCNHLKQKNQELELMMLNSKNQTPKIQHIIINCEKLHLLINPLTKRDQLLSNYMKQLKNQLQKQQVSLERIICQFNSIILLANQQTLELDQQIKQLKLETECSKTKFQNNCEAITLFEQTTKNFKKKIAKLAERKGELQDQLLDSQQERKILKAMYENQKKQNAQVEKKFKELIKEYKKLQQQQKKSQEDLEIISKKHAKTEQQKLEIETLFRNLEKECVNLKETLSILRVENSELKSHEHELQATVASLTRHLNEFKQINELEKQQIIKSKNRLQQDFFAKSKQLQQTQRLELQYAKTVKENQTLKQQLQQVSEKLQKYLHKSQSNRYHQQLREAELQRLLSQNEKLSRQIEIYLKQIKQLSKQIDDLKRINENYKNRHLIQSKKTMLFEEGYFNSESLSSKELKLKTLSDLHGLIKKHRKQISQT